MPETALIALPAVLVVDAGASALKYALHVRAEAGAPTPRPLRAGRVVGLEPGGRPRLLRDGQAPEDLPSGAGDGRRPEAAWQAVLAELEGLAATVQLQAVAHRIGHGGPHYRAPVALDDAVLAMLATLEPLAPLHQPYNLAGVRAASRHFPRLPHIGCFDTAFHATLPRIEQRYALPQALHEQGLRRYGYHGLSCQHVMHTLQQRSARAPGRVLLVHLGHGASLSALSGGISLATTTGFSPLDGLPMATRCGQLDPGLVLQLWRQGWALHDVEQLLYRESGLLGVSGLSGELRALRVAALEGHAGAQAAIDLFDHRLRREAGAMIATLGGVDVIAFTGEIGTRDAQTRAELVHALSFLDIRLDPMANQSAPDDRATTIHGVGSSAEVWVVPGDAGRVAAEAAWALLDTPPRRS